MSCFLWVLLVIVCRLYLFVSVVLCDLVWRLVRLLMRSNLRICIRRGYESAFQIVKVLFGGM